MSQKPTVPSQRLAHLASTLDRLSGGQGASRSLLKRLNVPDSVLEQREGQIPIDVEVEFCVLATEMLGIRNFATQAGLSFKSAHTLTNYIAKYSKDLKSAIEAGARYHVLTDPTTLFWLQTSGQKAIFQTRCGDPDIAWSTHHREFILSAALATMRNITGVPFYPLEVKFRLPDDGQGESVQKAFGCPVTYGSEMDEIILAPSTLTLPVPTHDSSLRNHLVNYGEMLLSQASEADMGLRTRIEKLLLDGLPGRLPSADEIAANLGMSRRTFARRLSDNNVSFREIVDRLRESLARSYLKDGLPISEVAYVLDYSDQAAFTTAFKRWTGSTPKAFAMGAIPA
ncbi:MAG: AraC family transcriptional regulator ligand-binding domain-containing protein [Pseudoruegeria sp.]